jgi:spermidine synthase
VLVLYAAYSWLDLYTPALLLTSVVVGGLIGAEVPLLMSLMQRIRAQDAGEATADLFAVDYVGALAGGLAFPFLLLPVFGQVRGAVVVAAVNLLAAVVVVVLLRDALSARARRVIGVGVVSVAVALGLAGATAGSFLVSARQALYDDPVVVALRSDYQDIVLTSARGFDDVRLFLDGDLQFASSDERRYHEALVHPALLPGARSVLVLGGGDGLALREVLRHDAVERVVEVELDPAVLELARTDPRMVRANEGRWTTRASSSSSPTRWPGCGPPTRSSTRSSWTCPTPTRRRPRSSTRRSSTAWPPGARPRAAGWWCSPGRRTSRPRRSGASRRPSPRPACARPPTTSTSPASATGASCWPPAAPRPCRPSTRPWPSS